MDKANDDVDRLSAGIEERPSEIAGPDVPSAPETRAPHVAKHNGDGRSPSQPGYGLPEVPIEGANTKVHPQHATAKAPPPAFIRWAWAGVALLDVPAAIGVAVLYVNEDSTLHLIGRWAPYLVSAAGLVAVLVGNYMQDVFPTDRTRWFVRGAGVVAVVLLPLALVAENFALVWVTMQRSG